MNYKYQYSTFDERQSILDSNKDKFLIEEQNITDGNFLIFTDDEPLNEQVYNLQEQLKTPDDKYKELDLTAATLDQVKQAKKDQLDYLCTQAITDGFDYTLNGVSYRFSCSVEAQSNFIGSDSLFKDGLITQAIWTVVNNSTGAVERITLDQATFNSIKPLVFQHISSNVSKFRDTLEPQVDTATTNAEVDAVVW